MTLWIMWQISVSVSLLMSSWTISPICCFHGPDQTRLASLGGEVCPPFKWNTGNISTFSLLWFSDTLSCFHAALPCWKGYSLSSNITWTRQQKAGIAPILRGWDYCRAHCSSLLLKAWDGLRGSLLPGLDGFLLHLDPWLGWEGFGWELVQLQVPHISLVSLISASPCITPWHQKMCLQSSVQDGDNDYEEERCAGAESLWQVTSQVSTQHHENGAMEKFLISRS